MVVGPNKILTVSYGTFSCTLEGFDDPFSTMRSIAEYFRDLAADDRYFGAEPPTPDAEMLHRIAQREVHRRVETSVKNDSVVLRQLDADTSPADHAAADTAAETPVAAMAPEAPPEPEAIADAFESPGATGTDEPKAQPDMVAEQAEEADAEGADLAEETEQPISAEAASQSQPEWHPNEPEADEEPQADAVWTPGDEVSVTIEDIYAEDEEPQAYEPEAPAAAATAPDGLPADDNSVAAKLSRIRAVVSGGAVNQAAPGSDDRFAGSIDAAFAGSGEVEDAEFEDIMSAEPAAETGDEDGHTETPGETRAVGAAPRALTEEQDEDEAGETASDGAPEGLAARIVKLKRAAHAMSHHEEADEALPESTLSETDEAELRAELALAETEDGENLFTEESEFEEISDEADDEVAAASTEEPAADPMRSAIARITESAGDFDVVKDETDVSLAEDPTTEASDRHTGFDTAKAEESAFDRILEQTNTRMDEDEGSRRRSAIAHLKAAVAATKADRLLNRSHGEAEDAEEQSQYRDDLAKVVQPRRPVTEPREAGTDTAAPLVLVSEQRIDRQYSQFEQKEATVAPHRVSTRDLDEVEDDAGFSDFAAKMGANDLPDLLEAAAAYTAFVEGNKLFSRPELMRRVAHMEAGEEFTREAGLRSFGQLLRQGKIQKLKRGQFTITEETRFNPQARLAGE